MISRAVTVQPQCARARKALERRIVTDFSSIPFWVVSAVLWWAATTLIPAGLCLFQYRQRWAAFFFTVACILGSIVIIWFWDVYMLDTTPSFDPFM